MGDSFSCRRGLGVNGREYQYYSLQELGSEFDISRLPFCLKILLENLLRNEDGIDVTPEDIKSVAFDVMRHRIILSYEAEAEDVTTEQIIQRVLDTIEVP